MIYEYKKLGIKVTADSKENALEKIQKAVVQYKKYKITAMSFLKDRLEKEIKDQTPNIITWWCLCWYLKNVSDSNNLINHEKVKLKGLLAKLASRKYRGKNSNKVKKKIIETYWIEECEFDKNQMAIISEFMDKFDTECIEYNENLFKEIAKNFGKEIGKIIDIVCNGDLSSVSNYVETTF